MRSYRIDYKNHLSLETDSAQNKRTVLQTKNAVSSQIKIDWVTVTLAVLFIATTTCWVLV